MHLQNTYAIISLVLHEYGTLFLHDAPPGKMLLAYGHNDICIHWAEVTVENHLCLQLPIVYIIKFYKRQLLILWNNEMVSQSYWSLSNDFSWMSIEDIETMSLTCVYDTHSVLNQSRLFCVYEIFLIFKACLTCINEAYKMVSLSFTRHLE